jgi:hypothetical protein
VYDVTWAGLAVGAILVILVGASVLHFGLRGTGGHPGTPRHSVYGPVVFGTVGGAAGVAAAMLFRYDEMYNRVYLEKSLPLLIAGVFVGHAVGRLVERVHRQCPRLRAWIEVTGAALLLGGAAAVLGWLSGDKREGNPPAEMGWGLLGGLVLGAAVGVIGRTRARAGMSPVPTIIRGLRVLAYSPIDGRHRFTGANERRAVDVTGAEVLFGPVAGLAVCEEADGAGVILFGCDADWRPVGETACTTLATAQAQAEFEYKGVTRTWVAVTW